MRTTHHLNEQMLLAYSAGILPEAFDLVIACHLYLSEQSRAMQCCYDALGGVVLDGCEKAHMSSSALSATLHQIKTSPCDCQAPRICTGTFPEPLQAYVGPDLEHIRWRRSGKGLRQANIPLSGDARAWILFVPPGKVVPDSSPEGTGMTLTLKGSYHYGDTRFRRGDIEISPPLRSAPAVACQKKGCVCLCATDQTQQKTWLHRLIPGFYR